MGDEVNGRMFGALERDVKHLTDRIEKLEGAISRLESTLGKLNDLLNQARGARIVLAAIIAVASFSVGLVSAARFFR